MLLSELYDPSVGTFCFLESPKTESITRKKVHSSEAFTPFLFPESGGCPTLPPVVKCQSDLVLSLSRLFCKFFFCSWDSEIVIYTDQEVEDGEVVVFGRYGYGPGKMVGFKSD
jgi:hypothetical protein